MRMRTKSCAPFGSLFGRIYRIFTLQLSNVGRNAPCLIPREQIGSKARPRASPKYFLTAIVGHHHLTPVSMLREVPADWHANYVRVSIAALITSDVATDESIGWIAGCTQQLVESIPSQRAVAAGQRC
jgi:hypothetical protein